MKNLLKYLMIAAMAVIVCTACSKDDEDNGDNSGVDKSKNYVLYNGKNYVAVSAQLIDYEDYYENGTYGYGIELALEGGSIVEIDILLANSTFPEGSKTYDYSTSHAAGTMDAFFYSIGSESSGESGSLKSGSATVSKNGNTYEISFNVTTLDDKPILGHYKETVD
jgi:hypothetical protein